MKTRQQIESIARSKRKMRNTLILLGVFVVFLAGAIVASVLIRNNAKGNKDGSRRFEYTGHNAGINNRDQRCDEVGKEKGNTEVVEDDVDGT